MTTVTINTLYDRKVIVKDVSETECVDGVFRCFDVLGNVLFWARADNIDYILFDYEEVQQDAFQ